MGNQYDFQVYAGKTKNIVGPPPGRESLRHEKYNNMEQIDQKSFAKYYLPYFQSTNILSPPNGGQSHQNPPDGKWRKMTENGGK